VPITVSEIYVVCLDIGSAHIFHIRSRTFDTPCPVQSHRDYVNRAVILSVALYGRETPSLALNEEHKPRVSENRVIGNILGPGRN